MPQLTANGYDCHLAPDTATFWRLQPEQTLTADSDEQQRHAVHAEQIVARAAGLSPTRRVYGETLLQRLIFSRPGSTRPTITPSPRMQGKRGWCCVQAYH